MSRTQVFISYSHRDVKWLQRLQTHLKPLERKGLIDLWDDTRIEAGAEWRKEIKEALASAKMAVLLVSANFFASDFIAENELPPLLKAAQEEGARILSVILSPCRYERMPELAQFQAMNSPDKPLISLKEHEQEAVFERLAKTIEGTSITPVHRNITPLTDDAIRGHVHHFDPNDDLSDQKRGNLLQNRQKMSREIARLRQQWDLLNDKLTALEKQRILETRAEEKFRLEHLIKETKTELYQIDQQLEAPQHQLAKTFSDSKDSSGRNNVQVRKRLSLRGLIDRGRFIPALIFVLIVLVILLFLRSQEERAHTSAIWLAYGALEEGHLAKAAERFERLVEQKSPRLKGHGYTGLAALALKNGHVSEAMNLVKQAEHLSQDISYTKVISGNILLASGQIDAAVTAYHAAIERNDGTAYQKASAFHGLGRIHAWRKDDYIALEQYNKALELYQKTPGNLSNSALVTTDKAHIMGRLGRWRKASELYRGALQMNASDPFIATLLHEAERRREIAEDSARQEEIDRYVDDLLHEFMEHESGEQKEDGWTSTPLTVAFMPFEESGPPSYRAGAASFILHTIRQTFQGNRITVVDEEILERLLNIVESPASKLGDPAYCARLARIVKARIVIMTRLTADGTSGRLEIRVFDSQSQPSGPLKVFTKELKIDLQSFNGSVMKTAIALFAELRSTYPLRARIAKVSAEGVTLNIGGEVGTTPGLVFDIFVDEEPVDISSRDVEYPGKSVGRIRVTTVDGDRSRAEIVKKTRSLLPTWKAQELGDEDE